ncbi:MAG: hypothetical protein ACPL1K_02615, partial [Candidatus Kryptoniota bacterium]
CAIKICGICVERKFGFRPKNFFPYTITKKEVDMLTIKTKTSENEDARHLTLRLLDELFSGDVMFKVGVRLWDGTLWPDDSPREATLVLKHPGALRAMLLPATEVGLGEAYLYDDFDIEGNIEAAFELADVLAEKNVGWQTKIARSQ